MNVLIPGGSGLIGRKTVLRLLEDDAVTRVVSMDVMPPPDWMMNVYRGFGDRFAFCRGSVAELETILDAIQRYGIDRIVNLAFILPGAVEADPRLAIKVNYLGMCNAFEAARLTGINRVIYASSEGVYGPQDEYGDRDVTEDDHLHPGSSYALAKQQSEMLAAQYAERYGMHVTGLRPATCFGHGGKNPREIRQFSELVSLAAVGKPFVIEDDGMDVYSLFTPDDIGLFTAMLCKADSSPHPVYNVGSPPYSYRDVAAVVKKYLPDSVFEFGTVSMQAARGKAGIPWRISMTRAKEDFGFEVRPLDEAVLTHINDARSEAGMESIRV